MFGLLNVKNTIILILSVSVFGYISYKYISITNKLKRLEELEVKVKEDKEQLEQRDSYITYMKIEFDKYKFETEIADKTREDIEKEVVVSDYNYQTVFSKIKELEDKENEK